MTEIKPCPFCGSDDTSYMYAANIRCNKCLARGPSSKDEDKEDAIQNWNKANKPYRPIKDIVEKMYPPPLIQNLDLAKQQRFELVKVIIPMLIPNDDNHAYIAEQSTKLADAVLEKLK
jgi:hypothetical protein